MINKIYNIPNSFHNVIHLYEIYLNELSNRNYYLSNIKVIFNFEK